MSRLPQPTKAPTLSGSLNDALDAVRLAVSTSAADLNQRGRTVLSDGRITGLAAAGQRHGALRAAYEALQQAQTAMAARGRADG